MGPGCLAVERNYRLSWGAGAATSPSTPGRLVPPGLPVCGRPSSAAPDLTCSVSIARERRDYKGAGWLPVRRNVPGSHQGASRPRCHDDALVLGRQDGPSGRVRPDIASGVSVRGWGREETPPPGPLPEGPGDRGGSPGPSLQKRLSDQTPSPNVAGNPDQERADSGA